MALSFVAPRRELDIVIQALPQEYDRLRSPGLISLLPDPLRELLSHPSNRVSQTVSNGVTGNFLSVRENSNNNLFVLPNSFGHSAQRRGAIQTHYEDSNGGIGAFIERQQFVRESTTEINFENVVQTVGTNALKRFRFVKIIIHLLKSNNDFYKTDKLPNIWRIHWLSVRALLTLFALVGIFPWKY